MSDDDWLGMTPRQLMTIWRRRMSDMQSTELMFSRLTSAVYNSGFRYPKEPLGDDAFMLHPLPKPPEPPPEPIGDAVLRMLKKAHWAKEAVN